MSTTDSGPTWQAIATAASGAILAIAIGAGSYFMTQQASHDNRQDVILDTMTAKLVDLSITLVKIQQEAAEAARVAQKAQDREESRDHEELEEYRHMQQKGKK